MAGEKAHTRTEGGEGPRANVANGYAPAVHADAAEHAWQNIWKEKDPDLLYLLDDYQNHFVYKALQQKCGGLWYGPCEEGAECLGKSCYCKSGSVADEDMGPCRPIREDEEHLT
eukprot:2852751-Amphidinium_carterae.1